MIHLLIAFALVLTQVVVAKLVFDRFKLSRWVVWSVPLSAYAIVHFTSIDQPPFLRMVLLCCVLMAGMKWVVYSEWRRESVVTLPWSRWLCFALLWFGMDPAAWVGTKRQLSWRNDAAWGAGCAIVGTAAVMIMAVYEIGMLPVLFVFMSLAFHFGALRLLTAFWRMMGMPVRPLFRNPLVTCGCTDFWSRRWNLAYSLMMARAVKRPIAKRVGNRVAVFVVFIVSGLLHELAITVPVQGGYGLPTCFFIAQGVLTVSEKRQCALNGVLCGLSLVFGIYILFPAAFVEAVIIPARDVLNLF